MKTFTLKLQGQPLRTLFGSLVGSHIQATNMKMALEGLASKFASASYEAKVESSAVSIANKTGILGSISLERLA